MPKVLTDEQILCYWDCRARGMSMQKSATAAKFSLTSARKIEGKGHVGNRDFIDGSTTTEAHVPEPKRYDQLSKEAQDAYDNFPYFCERYLGRIRVPWQQQAAEFAVQLMETPDEEYAVINAPPGSGKTFLFTHDFPLWLTVRNRAIRGQLGSVTGYKATLLTNALRRSLERTTPVKAKTQHLKQGTAINAVATIAGDYGRFKPLEREVWTKDQFIVSQFDGASILDKDPTWSAWGFDQAFIGGRYDVVIWDDVVDPKKHRTIEAIELFQDQWDDQGESRLEPEGILLLQGQRLAPNDLYRYCLDKVVPDVVDEDTGDILDSHPFYHHLKFKAHYPELCDEGTHKHNAPAYGEGGCLLYPSRLPFSKIARLQSNNRHFETVYQQEDVDPSDVLVPEAWIDGKDGYPGCLDVDRDRLELPHGLAGPLFSCMSVDPSPTRFWGIEWWVYDPTTELRYLMDLEKKIMEAGDFLDWNPLTQTYSGLLEEWWQTSVSLGQRITHVIVEVNSANKFLLGYKHVQNWMALRGCRIVPHTTHKNKSDPELGVETIAPHYQYGRVRLPAKPRSQGLAKSLQLRAEVTKYGSQAGKTTDLTMAHWFFEFQLPYLYHRPSDPKKVWVPSWQKSSEVDPQMRPLNLV